LKQPTNRSHHIRLFSKSLFICEQKTRLICDVRLCVCVCVCVCARVCVGSLEEMRGGKEKLEVAWAAKFKGIFCACVTCVTWLIHVCGVT